MSSKLNELTITSKVTASNIISILISIRIMFLRFRTNPKIPTRNNTNDNVMHLVIVPIGFLCIISLWVSPLTVINNERRHTNNPISVAPKNKATFWPPCYAGGGQNRESGFKFWENAEIYRISSNKVS